VVCCLFFLLLAFLVWLVMHVVILFGCALVLFTILWYRNVVPHCVIASCCCDACVPLCLTGGHFMMFSVAMLVPVACIVFIVGLCPVICDVVWALCFGVLFLVLCI